MAGRIASGARVLDAFSYQGGFSMAAIAGGAARVVAVDTSARALEIARQVTLSATTRPLSNRRRNHASPATSIRNAMLPATTNRN